MRPLARVLYRGQKAFSEPPFWTQRLPWAPAPGTKEVIENSFEGYVQAAYKRNGIIFACILARMLVFTEARFQWRRFEGGRPGELFGDPSLAILEKPWPNGTTGELLARMEQDASLAGNFYATIREGRIRRLRPDWVTIITGSPTEDPFDIDAKVVGYLYEPKQSVGGLRKAEPLLLTPNQVCHYSPLPDPEAQWRGMSWLTPVLDEVRADSAATTHKLNFFRQGAQLGIAVSVDAGVKEDAFNFFVEKFKDQHEGAENAYKTLFLGGGADVKTIQADFQQLDLAKTQGRGETRIAAAAGVHPVIVGLSEGLQGSSLNAGNYQQVRRRFGDMTIRPLWRIAAASLQRLVTPPDPGAHLWYDARDVPFLQDDAKQEAEVRRLNAQTIGELVKGGFTPESAIRAVETGDYSQLRHTGLVSVQLQPAVLALQPGEQEDE